MESTKRQKTCEERIEDELQQRLEQLLPDVRTWGVLKCARHLKAEGRTLRTADIDQLRDEVFDLIRDRAAESVLSIDQVTTYKVCLSWGGPADYFELDWSTEARTWIGGRYLFQDWFDGARRSISADQVEELANLFGIDPEAG